MKLSLKTLAVAALALLSSGCNGQKTINYFIQDSFSDERRQLLYEAADRWNVHSWTRCFHQFVSEESDANVTIVTAIAPLMGGVGRDGAYTGHQIKIRRDIQSNDVFLMVAIHEMGHAMGNRGHLPPDTGLMSPEGNPNGPFITSADIDFCREIGCCP